MIDCAQIPKTKIQEVAKEICIFENNTTPNFQKNENLTLEELKISRVIFYGVEWGSLYEEKTISNTPQITKLRKFSITPTTLVLNYRFLNVYQGQGYFPNQKIHFPRST